MDPRDRLWAELIFPWCAGPALFPLRAVCRSFRAQLDASRLWLPFTLELARMRYEERLLGWPGVALAMQREKTTHANCDAGRFMRGPTLDIPDKSIVVLAACRVAVFCDHYIALFNVETGARLASFDVNRRFSDPYKGAVLDRWIPCAVNGRALLLDCVAARLIEMAPEHLKDDIFGFSAAGPCVSYHAYSRKMVTVVRISSEPDGATVIREMACVRIISEPNSVMVDFRQVSRALLNDADNLVLCERGRSYLLFDRAGKKLRLVDVATGQLKRIFTPRACPLNSTAAVVN